MRFAGLTSLLIVGIVVAGGCGGDGGAETPTPRPTDATEAPPFSLTFEEFESDRLGYRIEIPEGWAHEEVPVEAGDETLVTETFAATTPIDGELPNITVFKAPADGRTVEEVVEEVLTVEEAAAIEEDDLVVAGHDAVRVDITDQLLRVSFDFTQVVIVIDDTEWHLIFVVEAGNRDKFLPIFEHVYNSFQPT